MSAQGLAKGLVKLQGLQIKGLSHPLAQGLPTRPRLQTSSLDPSDPLRLDNPQLLLLLLWPGSKEMQQPTPGPPRAPVAANPRQMNGMSEDEALAAALAASLETGAGAGSANGPPQQEGLTQEQEDLALARALQESEQMQRNRSHGQRQGQGVGSGD